MFRIHHDQFGVLQQWVSEAKDPALSAKRDLPGKNASEGPASALHGERSERRK